MLQPSLTLTELASRWETKRHPAAETARQMRLITHDLSALSHVSDARALTRGHLRAFHDDLLSHHPRPTARKMFGLAHALLQFGVSETLLDTNPAWGMTVNASTAAARPHSPFTQSELTRIFSHRVFTAHELPPQCSAAGIAAYWLPLILLCTGARLDTAAALRTDHLLYSADAPSVPYWRFDNHKSGPAQYRQPVHPILCRLGLLDYVRSLPPRQRPFPIADTRPCGAPGCGLLHLLPPLPALGGAHSRTGQGGRQLPPHLCSRLPPGGASPGRHMRPAWIRPSARLRRGRRHGDTAGDAAASDGAPRLPWLPAVTAPDVSLLSLDRMLHANIAETCVVR